MKTQLFRRGGLAAAILLLLTAALPLTAQSKDSLAPDQIPGVAVYVPFPVSISLDGNLDDWDGVPVQRVETGFPSGPDPDQNQYFDFALAADEDNLYVYMHSEDDNIIAGEHGQDFWNEDSMEFYLNFSNNLNAASYGAGMAQITINATNIGNSSVSRLSVSGTNNTAFSVKGKVFRTSDGWAFEASVPLRRGQTPSHGKNFGFQAHANGASVQDRDSKLIWSSLDTADQSYNNPSLFGRAVFFEVGRTDIPEPQDLNRGLAQQFEDYGAVGKAGRELIWADEFDYNGAPDSSRWAYDAPDSGKWNNELQTYTSSRSNSFVRDGKLHIRALKQGGSWTSARLFTRGKADWTYGYFEVRAMLPEGRGTWPAIWMMPARDSYGSWPRSGEIDIMEFVGFDPDKIHTSVHTQSYNHRIQTQRTRAAYIDGVSDGFHTYAVEWTEDGLFWYVDDKPFYYFTNEGTGSDEWPFDKPFYIILNVAMGGIWGGMNGMDPDLDSAEMVVDYVRVYR